ncbi:MAG TPA: right-handed parallel beta-helix repeat-containing protein, partial [Stenomitos sp.]
MAQCCHFTVGILLSLGLWVGSTATSATALTLYVSPTGDDGNPGTIAAPLRSIQTAIDRVGNQGGTVWLRGGIYELYQQIWVGTIATATRRLIIKAYPGEKPILDGTHVTGTYPQMLSIGGQYIDVEGLELRNAPDVSLSTWEAKNIRLRRNVVHHSFKTGIGIYNSSDVWVSQNTVYMTNLSNSSHTISGGWGMGISAGRSQNVTIANNTSFNNHGEGIGCFLAQNCRIVGNRVYDNYSVEIYLDNATQSCVAANLVYSTGDTRFYRYPWPASGIQMANEDYGADSNPLSDITITNNIVVNSGDGLVYGSYQKGGGLKRTRIFNNTFYKGIHTLVSLDRDANHEDTSIINNLFVQSGSGQMTYIPAVNGLTFRSNLWFGGEPTAIATSPSDLRVNPRFVAPGKFTAASY